MARILPALLDSKNKALAQFTGGYVWARFQVGSWQWIDILDTPSWNPTQAGLLLAYLPFSPGAWERAARWLGDDPSPYWSRTRANPYQAGDSLRQAIDLLVEHGRPLEAVGCLKRHLHEKEPLDAIQAIRVLQAVLDSPEAPRAVDGHGLREVFKALQENPDAPADDLCRLEWSYLPVLDRLARRCARNSSRRRLAADPAFFCEIIRILYRPKGTDRPAEEPSREQLKVAENAYRLLSGMEDAPGTTRGGAFDGGTLKHWLEQVKSSCTASGHLGVALTHVGHVLAYAPPDPDGLWLHRSVAAELNAKDAGDLRDGFVSELFTSRGVFWASGGQEEQELAAAGHRSRAEAIEAQGFHRLADSLRKLAHSYDRDAEREAAERDHFE